MVTLPADPIQLFGVVVKLNAVGPAMFMIVTVFTNTQPLLSITPIVYVPGARFVKFVTVEYGPPFTL